MESSNAITQVVVAVIFKTINNEVRYLIARRAPDQSGAGEWEFPGGKVESSETHIQALHREIFEELHIEIEVRSFIADHVVNYPQKTVHLHFYLCEAKTFQTSLTDHDAAEWVSEKQMALYPFSYGDQVFLEKSFSRVSKLFPVP